jgi:hypothetical protein
VPGSPELKVWPEPQVPKAAPQSESLAQLAELARQVPKVQSERRAHKATDRTASLAQLEVAARPVCKARSAQPVPKAPLVR